MTPKELDLTLQLLRNMITMSPKARTSIVTDYMLQVDGITKEQMAEILAPYKALQEQRSASGRAFGNKRRYPQPGFIVCGETPVVCVCCQGVIPTGSPMFIFKRGPQHYDYWHPIEVCFPVKFQGICRANARFAKWTVTGKVPKGTGKDNFAGSLKPKSG